MDRKANLMACVQGKKTEYVPSGFWLHFPPDAATGEAAVQAHLQFFNDTGTHIMKIMNENVVPHDIPIHTASDWARLKPFAKDSPFIVQEIDLMKEIMDRTENPGVFLLTIHGIVASMWHARGGTDGYETGRGMLAAHLRENPKAFQNGLNVVTDALVTLTESALEAGVDGIYYAALGGEKNLFTEEEFTTYIAPCDKEILAVAKQRPCFNVLHICKDHLELSRYVDYPADVVNWGIYEHNISLQEGRSLFKEKAILGGFDDRSGLFVDGTISQIEEYAKALVKEMGTTKFILGADCTLPTEIDRARIRAAVNAVR